MKPRTEVAAEKFLSGYNCAQSVLYAFCDDLHLDKDMGLRMACGFGGGMGKKQATCGAVTGGIIALGLKHGRGEDQDRTPGEVTYRKVAELMTRFEGRHGTCLCRSLLNGCDLNTPEGQRYFKENNLRLTTCKVCVETAVQIVEQLF